MGGRSKVEVMGDTRGGDWNKLFGIKATSVSVGICELLLQAVCKDLRCSVGQVGI